MKQLDFEPRHLSANHKPARLRAAADAAATRGRVRRREQDEEQDGDDSSHRGDLADAVLKLHAEKALRFDCELHRQFAEHVLAEAVDDERDGVLLRDAALL